MVKDGQDQLCILILQKSDNATEADVNVKLLNNYQVLSKGSVNFYLIHYSCMAQTHNRIYLMPFQNRK